jgi:TonB family protein
MRMQSSLTQSIASIVVGVAMMSVAPPAGAQAAAAAPSGLVAPRPTNTVTPEYPESRKSSGESARVGLTLTLDEAGAVIDVAVTSSGGAEFDRAALAAARRLTFSPAMRDGKPIAARIPFSFAFSFEKEPPAAPAPAPLAAFGGKVLTQGEEPLPGASVTLTVPGGTPVTVSTDAEGGFRVDGLAPGRYHVAIVAPGLAPFASEELLAAGNLTEVTYRPRPASVESIIALQELQVVGARPPREVTRRVLEPRELQKMPGTNGDALGALESMPGVARAPSFASQLVVRGAGPHDTTVLIDGTPVPIAYHFGGLNSVVPSPALSHINFTPGNFGAEYGRAMGGIVDVGIKSPRKDRWGGMMQLDVLDARILAEGPLSEKLRLMVAVRRSWVDTWLGPVMKSAGPVSFSALPVYYDGQAVLEYDLAQHTTARLALIGSDDNVALVTSAPTGTDPITGASGALRFWRVQLRADTRVTERIRWVNTLAYGLDREDVAVGSKFLNTSRRPLSLRSDLRAHVSDAVTAIVGLDATATAVETSAKLPLYNPDGVDSGPRFARPSSLLTSRSEAYRPAAYAMLELTPLAGMKLLPSARVDYTGDIKEWRVSPRIATRIDLHPTSRRTTVKGGVGLYYQPPEYQESIRPFGTPSVSSNRSIHTSVGVEQELSRQVDVSVEGFYKRLDQLVVRREAATSTQGGQDFTNEGSGRIYGGELLLRYRNDARFFGWVAYTLSRSERRDSSADAYRLFDFDQTHILTVLGSYKLGRGWEVGARFRYVTGNPYTPAVAGILDADAGAYAPVNGPRGSARSPAFHRLDVRVEKTWTFEDWKLSAYLDVQNAYNRRNPEGRTSNFNFTRSDILVGLPILPVIGLRGEL